MRLRIGKSVDLRPVGELAKVFNVSERHALRILRQLGVGLFYIGQTAYFRADALEKAVFAVTRFGSDGFACFGSKEYIRIKCRIPPYKRKKMRLAHVQLDESTIARLTKDIDLEMDEVSKSIYIPRRKAVSRAVRSQARRLIHELSETIPPDRTGKQPPEPREEQPSDADTETQ